MKEIPVSKRHLILAIILAVVIAIGILLVQQWPLRVEQSSTPTTSEDSMASSTAVSAVEAVFQIDYRENEAVWLKRICDVSTSTGCQLFTAGADRLWKKYVDDKSVVTAKAQAVEKVADNGSEQVWQMIINLSSPLPGSNKTQDTAYIALKKTDNGWQFDRFLMESEINVLVSRQKITSTPANEGKK
ncbi:MAG: hypothetical protein LLG42_07245 [Chloroflexi bacterium]|nr:hypothetical protein [Chloroflexota bacterium]